MFQKFIRNSYLYKFIVLSSQTNNLYFVHFSIDVAPALENGWTQFCVLLWTAPVLIMMFFFFFFSCDFALQSTTAISLSFRKIQVALNLNPERLCGNDCTLTELYQIHRRHTIGPTSTLNNHPN